MSLLDNVDKVAFASSIPTDLMLGSFSGSLSSPSPGSTLFPSKTSTSVTITTGISEKTLFQGVFSTDGGTTWCDFNSNIAARLGSFSNLQTQMMYGYSKANSLTLTADNWNVTSDGTHWNGSAYTFMYKVVLFNRPGQGDVTPQPLVESLNFSAQYNYQKIFRDSTFDFTFPVGTNTATITHNLGYVPKFRCYIDNFSSGLAPDNAALMDYGYFISQFSIFQCYADTTTIKYFVDNSGGVSALTGTLYTRIYYHDA